MVQIVTAGLHSHVLLDVSDPSPSHRYSVPTQACVHSHDPDVLHASGCQACKQCDKIILSPLYCSNLSSGYTDLLTCLKLALYLYGG